MPTTPDFPERLDAPKEIETPGATTIDALAQFLSIDPRATSKAMPVVRLSDGKLVLGLVRGDHRLHELKLQKLIGEFRPAQPDEIREAFGADGGSLGPVGFQGEILADEALREGQYVAGANRNGWHLLGVEAGRDFEPSGWADIRHVEEGDGCIHCGGSIHIQPAIEVGNIFKLGTRYSVPLEATYLDDTGQEHPIVMGSYGIGPARTMAAIIEQHHDEQGILWPESVAPFDDHIVALVGAEEIAEQAAVALSAGGPQRPPRRPRRARRGEVRGRRPDRDPAPDHRRQEEPRGRRRRRARPARRRGAARPARRPGLMAKRRRYASEQFGPAVERLMNETGVTYRALAAKTGLSAGYLNHLVHGNRPVPSNDVVETLASALDVEPEYFREYRLRVITEKLEAMPDLVDRLYKRLNG